MRQSSFFLGIGLIAGFFLPASVFGHSPYGSAQKAKYELRSVSCYACHAKGKDKKTGKPLGKEHLNSFGQAQAPLLKEKKLKERLEAARSLSRPERKEVYDAVAAEFLKIMEKLENKPAVGKKTWLDLIKNGEIEGIKL